MHPTIPLEPVSVKRMTKDVCTLSYSCHESLVQQSLTIRYMTKSLWLLSSYARNGDSISKELPTPLPSTLTTKTSFTLQLRKNSIDVKYVGGKSSAHTISTSCISLDEKTPVLTL